MGLSLQRKLELAGDLARVQPLLVRLHLIEKPEPQKRRRARYFVVAGSVIALGTLVAAVAFGRKRCQTSEPEELHGFAQTGAEADVPGAPSESGIPDEPSTEIQS